MVKYTKGKDSRKRNSVTSGRIKTNTSRALRKTDSVRAKRTIEDPNASFMKKMIAVTVILSFFAVGLAIWSFMKANEFTFDDIFKGFFSIKDF